MCYSTNIFNFRVVWHVISVKIMFEIYTDINMSLVTFTKYLLILRHLSWNYNFDLSIKRACTVHSFPAKRNHMI